jgi:hypothetical protein
MNNPLEILRTLEKHLTKPAELTLFGRSALALGYPNSPPDFGATHDVDGIIPADGEEPNLDFWLAQQATNVDLQHRGLYITHLFSEMDVILRPDWHPQRVSLELALLRLKVSRPATIDLVLTKMARGDTQDLEDIQFLLAQERLSPEQLRNAFAQARVPDVPEIRELFVAAQPRVLSLAGEIVK